eukprot:733926_1
MVLFLALFCIACIESILGQYIIETKLTTTDVELFCPNQCGSTFGSIHSEQQFQSVQSLSNYNIDNGIWIGLKAIDDKPTYSWIDTTPFDFAKWAANEPSGNSINKQCVTMATQDFEWAASQCDIAKRSLCNHCNGKLNKYILLYLDTINSGYSYSSAQTA